MGLDDLREATEPHTRDGPIKPASRGCATTSFAENCSSSMRGIYGLCQCDQAVDESGGSARAARWSSERAGLNGIERLSHIAVIEVDPRRRQQE